MEEYNKIINDMEKCFYILNTIIENNNNNNTILVFAFGAASYSKKSLVNIYNSLDAKYTEKHIILYCFDCGFEEIKILSNTKKDLCEINFVEIYKDKNINLLKKNTNQNLFNIILSNLKMPLNDELILSTQYLNNSIKQNTLNNFFDYMLSSNKDYNIQFQEFLTNIINFIHPEETIFINDLYFNSWCYYYYDSQTNNLKCVSTMPIIIYDKNQLTNIAETLKIKLPEKGDRIIRGMYDTNIFFSQMIWVIKVMEDLYKTKKIIITEHGQHINNNNDFLYLKYK